MQTTETFNCCPPLSAALAHGFTPDAGAALLVHAGADGRLYYKIAAGHHPDQSHAGRAREPLSFCPFCGQNLRGGAHRHHAHAPRAARDTDEEITILAGTITLL